MQPEPYERFWQQLDEIQSKQGKTFSVWPPQAVKGSGIAPEFVYESRKMVCRTGRDELVRSRLDLSAATTEDLPDTDLRVLTLPEHVDLHANIRQANRDSPPDDPNASLNHLVSITDPVNICPADEPVPVAADAQPWPPPVADPSTGRDIEILVIDTGIIEDVFHDPGYLTRHPWLSNVVKPPKAPAITTIRANPFEIVHGPGRLVLADGEDTVTKTDPYQESGGIRVIKEYAGHGTFVAGVIGCAAPAATIWMHNALQRGGASVETELGTTLVTVLAEYARTHDGRWPQIISLSAGSPTQGGRPLMGLTKFLAQLADHAETVLIAAAGNDGRRDDVDGPYHRQTYHFQPAASAPTHDGVISVGALRRRAKGRACFTNYGTSVSVYARGEEHINAFLRGEYEYHHGLDPHCHNYDPPLYCPCSCVTSLPYHGHSMFQGMARWSGTSFSTPLVAGMVAAHLSAHPELGTARAAAHDLITQQAPAITDVDGEPIRVFL